MSFQFCVCCDEIEFGFHVRVALNWCYGRSLANRMHRREWLIVYSVYATSSSSLLS